MRAVVRSDEGGGRPLVCVPGIDGSGDMLLGTAARLAAKFRLVRLSYEGDGPDTYGALARTVVDRLDDLGIRRAVLLSESFGGAVAMQAALDTPERIAGLAIVNSFAHYQRRMRLLLSRIGAPLVGPRLFRIGRRCIGRIAFFGGMPEPEAVRAFHGMRCSGRGGGAYRARLRMIAGLDLRPRLGEIRQPVALFVAGCDRIVDSARQARRMAARLPDVVLHEIPNGGHLVLPLAQLGWEDWMGALCERAGLS